MHKCTIAVRVMASLGIKLMLVTNAAGGVNRSFNVGDIMIIKDHIGAPLMAGMNPLVGANFFIGYAYPLIIDSFMNPLRSFSCAAFSLCLSLVAFQILQLGAYINGSSSVSILW